MDQVHEPHRGVHPAWLHGTIVCADIRADLPKISYPTFVIITEQSGLGTNEATKAWQQ